MSTVTLARPKVNWSDEAKINVGSNEAWFEEFDRAMAEFDEPTSLTVRQDAGTWYVVNDMDVTFPSDPAPSLGLDTWNF